MIAQAELFVYGNCLSRPIYNTNDDFSVAVMTVHRMKRLMVGMFTPTQNRRASRPRPSLYKAEEKPNTHWSNWPDGDTL